MTTAPGTPERREQDKAMIENPKRWPYWPWLPLKRRGSQYVESGRFITPDYPTVLLNKGGSMQLVLAQLAIEGNDSFYLAMGATGPVPDELRARYEELVVHRYDDVDAMLDAGWTVD